MTSETIPRQTHLFLMASSSTETKLPDALVIGPMRAATTWVHRYLKQRGDTCLPTDVKETFFFDRRFEKGLDWYAQHFQNCQNRESRIVMEVGSSYFHSDEAPERIRNTLGGSIPLIVIYRDPVERSFSHFAHLRRYGLTSLPLREAAEEFPEILAASRYAEQLRRWADYFGRDCLTILRLETLKDSSVQFARTLTQALNL
ncbi:MAG: sulfotransferase domain-containing protein, partial [Candidatus Bipolaricaulia bacterium]